MSVAVLGGSLQGERLRDSIDRASRYIVDMQARSGAWPDFVHYLGMDAWTTAYIGDCLLEAESSVRAPERRYLRAALERAAAFVLAAQRSDGTWGCTRLPSDCDSTSWAALFLTAMGRSPGEGAYRALPTFARSDGGFATFNGTGENASAASSWERSHPDVTPVAARALAGSRAEPLSNEDTLAYILAQRTPEGIWNSFWYATPLYATLHNLIALERVGYKVAPPATATLEALTATCDPFELALGLEIATRFAAERDRAFTLNVAAALLEAQSPQGSWVAAPLMRVTDQAIEHPWEFAGDAAGPLYPDEYYTFTTATVARALSFFARAGEGAREACDG